MERHFNYFGDWKSSILVCPNCGWKGTFEQGEVEYHKELMDCHCPACLPKTSSMLAIVSYPTKEEVEANIDKISPLDRVIFLAQKSRHDKWEKECLKETSVLPNIPDDKFVLSWDFEDDGEDVFTIIRYGNEVLWKEPAFYEGYERFIQVLHILKLKYGAKLEDVVPTMESEQYLYGDSFFAGDKVDKARASLRKQ